MRRTFRSLRTYNYRVYAGGSLASNIGTWMQRTAQDWLVLTGLTHNSASAVGIVTALQLGPQLFLLPFTGHAADHLDRRKLLMATQAAMGLLALGLGLLVIGGWARLWHVYGFALLLGCVSAFDVPASQAFVSDLVAESELTNAVALNSTSFNAARMVGPAIAGALIGMIGSGWVFVLNALSYVAMIGALVLLRVHALQPGAHVRRPRGRLADGFRYVRGRADLMTLLMMLGLIGAFSLNFPIFISTMAVGVFHQGAGRFGLLMSIMAIGSVTGALLAAGWERPRMRYLLGSTAALGAGFALAAAMPGYWLFAGMLVAIGIAAQIFTKTVIGWAQLSSAPEMRGRVMALVMAVAMGGTPIGSPIVGWVAQHFGPRYALLIAAASAVAALAVGIRFARRAGGEPVRDQRPAVVIE